MNKKIVIIITIFALAIVGSMAVYYRRAEKNTVGTVVANAPERTPQRAEAIQYKTIQSPYAITSYPQVVNYKDKKIEEKVNEQIKNFFADSTCFLGKDDAETKDNLINLITVSRRDSSEISGSNLENLSILELMKIASSTDAYSYDSGFEITYDTNDILSIAQRYSNYCGGAYPNDGIVAGITFDMRTGDKIEYENLFSNYGNDALKIENSMLSRPSLKSQAADELADECAVYYDPKSNDFDETHFRYADYYITEKGLFVIPSFPHVIKVCEIDFEVPIAAIKEFFDSKSILARIGR